MKLYIDTSDREKVIVGIDGKRFETSLKERGSEKILPFIDEVLKKQKKSVKDITEIEVNTGPGSFTGLRVGISIANTLGWQLNVPVNGKRRLTKSVDISYGKNKFNLFSFLKIIGIFLLSISLLILVLTFAPAAKEETKWQIQRISRSLGVEPAPVVPPDLDFSIVIPKIRVTAHVFANIDPNDSGVYLPVLTKGVAHAKGSSLPGENGNTYIFAHSTDAFYNIGRYNAVFYLLGKMTAGDEIDIYYKGKKIKYEVTDKKIIEANETKYLTGDKNYKMLVLQTCYPPGTTLKRLVVFAKQITELDL